MPLNREVFSFFLLIAIIASCISCVGQVTKKSGTQVNQLTVTDKTVQLPNAIWSIFHDKKGNYWYGSNGDGVFYYDNKKLQQYTTKDGLSGNQIRGIQSDHLGNIYFDTPTGISKYDGKQFTSLEPIYSNSNMWQSNPNDLWFKGEGNINGVYRYDGSKLHHLAFPQQDLKKVLGLEESESKYSPYGVYSTFKDNEGAMWFGTLAAGVYRYYDEEFLWIGEKELTVLEDGRVPGVRSITQDKDGKYWLSNILNRYNIVTDNDSTRYEKLEGINQSLSAKKMKLPYYMSAVNDDKSNLWFLTYNEGMWKYDGFQFYNYPIKDEGKDVLLFAMYKDNNDTIWVGTHNAGVYRYNGKTFEKYMIK